MSISGFGKASRMYLHLQHSNSIVSLLFSLVNDTLRHIQNMPKNETIRYICVSNEIVPNEKLPRVNVQIIFGEKRSTYTRFMDKFLS